MLAQGCRLRDEPMVHRRGCVSTGERLAFPGTMVSAWGTVRASLALNPGRSHQDADSTPSREAEKQTFPPPECCPRVSANTRLHTRSNRTEVTQRLVSATS